MTEGVAFVTLRTLSQKRASAVRASRVTVHTGLGVLILVVTCSWASLDALSIVAVIAFIALADFHTCMITTIPADFNLTNRRAAITAILIAVIALILSIPLAVTATRLFGLIGTDAAAKWAFFASLRRWVTVVACRACHQALSLE